MIFLVVVIIGGFALVPFAKKQAAKGGMKFSLTKHFIKVALLAIIVMIIGFIKVVYFSKQPSISHNPNTPINVQNNLNQPKI